VTAIGSTTRGFTRPWVQIRDVTHVTLEYCVPCGYRDRALNTQEAILTGVEREIDSFELVMGDHGVFRVDVDGDAVYDKAEDDMDTDDIVRAVRDAV